MNDYCDIDLDLASPQKDRRKAQYMADHRWAARGALVGLGVILLATATIHSSLLALAFVSNTVIVYIYSAWLKRWPLVDLAMMGIWGVTMALVGLPTTALPAVAEVIPASWRVLAPITVGAGQAAAGAGVLGWKLVGLLGLLCSSFEVIQVVRDEPGDRETGIITTGVLLGARRAAWLFRLIVAGSALYGGAVVGSWAAVALLAAGLLPLTPERADRTWDLCRLLFGAVWAAMLAQVYLHHLA